MVGSMGPIGDAGPVGDTGRDGPVGPARPAVSDGFVPGVPPPPAPRVSPLDKIDQLPIQWWLQLEPEKLRKYLGHPEKGPLLFKSLSEKLTLKELSALPPERISEIKTVFQDFQCGIFRRIQKLFTGANDLDDKIDGLVDLVSVSKRANMTLQMLEENRGLALDLTEFKSMQEQGACHKFYSSQTFLWRAFDQGDIGLTKFLVENGANVDVRYPVHAWPYYGQSLIQAAVSKGKIEFAKFLVENGANVHDRYPADHREFPGQSLIQAAVSKGSIESVKFLLEKRANVDDRYPLAGKFQGLTILEVALQKGWTDCVQAVLAHMTNEQKRMHSGARPLFLEFLYSKLSDFKLELTGNRLYQPLYDFREIIQIVKHAQYSHEELGVVEEDTLIPPSILLDFAYELVGHLNPGLPTDAIDLRVASQIPERFREQVAPIIRDALEINERYLRILLQSPASEETFKDRFRF